MNKNHQYTFRRRFARRLLGMSLVVLLTSTAGLAAAIWMPLNATAAAHNAAAQARRLAPIPADRPNLEPLLAKIAGSRLIRPASIQAAVKDDGSAQRLLKSLKLQGVVQMGENPVAYIQVEKQGIQTVQVGQSVLDFTVEKIEPGRVTLSLQGVVVTLSY